MRLMKITTFNDRYVSRRNYIYDSDLLSDLSECTAWHNIKRATLRYIANLDVFRGVHVFRLRFNSPCLLLIVTFVREHHKMFRVLLVNRTHKGTYIAAEL